MTTILVIFVLTRQGNIIYALNKLLTGKYHLHKNICIEHQNIYKNKHILALYIVKLKKFSLKYFIFVDTLFFMVFPHIAISLKFCDSRLPLKFFIALSIWKFAEFQERSTYITWPWCQRQWPWIYFVPGIRYTDTFIAL